jgi:hypothetical protein
MPAWVWPTIITFAINVAGWLVVLGKVLQTQKDHTYRITALETLVGVNKDRSDTQMATNRDRAEMMTSNNKAKFESDFAHRTMLAECAKAFGTINESLVRVETQLKLLIEGRIKSNK